MRARIRTSAGLSASGGSSRAKRTLAALPSWPDLLPDRPLLVCLLLACSPARLSREAPQALAGTGATRRAMEFFKKFRIIYGLLIYKRIECAGSEILGGANDELGAMNDEGRGQHGSPRRRRGQGEGHGQKAKRTVHHAQLRRTRHEAGLPPRRRDAENEQVSTAHGHVLSATR